MSVRQVARPAALEPVAKPRGDPARTSDDAPPPVSGRSPDSLPTPSRERTVAQPPRPAPRPPPPAQAEQSTALAPDLSAGAPERASPAEATAALAPPSTPLPTYRTAAPPSVDLDYEVLRGGVHGRARLEWRSEGGGNAASAPSTGSARRYTLALRGLPAVTGGEREPLAGPAALVPAVGSGRSDRSALAPHWTSQGSFDADGVAPERFAVVRRGKERHAANFRRDAGQISFSGPATTWPLAAGAQDRLSWMVQLAAILEADPALADDPSARISMLVVGAHGDADVWTLVAQGREALPGAHGENIDARRFRREARHAHDTDVEVWVARELHHLPVRLLLVRRQGGESTEFRWRALQPP
ncbi:MAG: DUF3108 domain-containing protein [Rubrivivax sp.]|nr:DUF3108 domain-containing protein [Rubrivivax sp.]